MQLEARQQSLLRPTREVKQESRLLQRCLGIPQKLLVQRQLLNHTHENVAIYFFVLYIRL